MGSCGLCRRTRLGPRPTLGLSLKLEEKSHTSGTELRTETQVGSALLTDTLFKENSLGNA